MLTLVDPPVPDPGEGGSPGGGTPAEPAKSFVTTDEFKQWSNTINGTLGAINETLGVLRANAQVHGQPQPKDDGPTPVSDEEFETAIANGDAKKIKAYYDFREHRLKVESIAPLEAIGLKSLGDLTRVSVLKDKAHYKRYQKEVDGYLASLPPAAQANPMAAEMAYQLIVGRHSDELVAEATEAAKRQAVQDPKQTGGGGSGSGRTGPGEGKSEVPSVKELLGEDAETALAFRGMTADDHARKLGYKSWEEYAKLIQEQSGAPAGAKK